MIVESTVESQQKAKAQPSRQLRNIPKAQETIYAYLLDIVKNWSPEEVLAEFRHLFIEHVNTVSSHILPSLYEIVFANQSQEFRNTLKRSCYILINNWDLRRSHKAIQDLIQLFDSPVLGRHTVSPTLRRLRTWIKEFVDSEDFEQLKLFAARYDERQQVHWSERYTSYLLVPQYIDLNNPEEQRHAARALARQLKEQFKFELAMYTAKSQAPIETGKKPRNPTTLGEDVLRLIKTILARRGIFSYTNLANIFVEQTRSLPYAQFKHSLIRYLTFSVEGHPAAAALRAQLTQRLEELYPEHNNRPLGDAMLLRTCNRMIDCLTTENRQEPSPLFVRMLSQGHPFTLVVVLLKLVLVCKYSRTHLEARIADLIQYYREYDETECQWVINFFEIFDITMTIYAENVEFNLVKMPHKSADSETPNPSCPVPNPLETYRIFSQLKKSNAEAVDDVDTSLLEALSSEAAMDVAPLPESDSFSLYD